jgi:hypothetical protein
MMKTSFKLSTCLALPLLVLSACHGYKDTGVATIRQNNADLKACIQEAAARNPNLKGKMELAFEIDPAGKVNRFAYVLDEYKDPLLAECVRLKSIAWTFPPPPSGKMEKFTYTFSN